MCPILLYLWKTVFSFIMFFGLFYISSSHHIISLLHGPVISCKETEGGGVFVDKNTLILLRRSFCVQKHIESQKHFLRRMILGVGKFEGQPSSGGGVFMGHYRSQKHVAVFVV